jgi:hypothetical protein
MLLGESEKTMSVRRFGMVQKVVKRRKPEKARKTLKEDLKKLSPPPGEHTYELKMERTVKRLVEKEEKKKAEG